MSSASWIAFPSVAVRSRLEYQRLAREEAAVAGEWDRREAAIRDVEPVSLDGTCGACLRVTEFTSPDLAGPAPDWRGQQLCGCPHGLTACERALVHLARLRMGGSTWFRAGVLGEGSWSRMLATHLPGLTTLPPFSSEASDGLAFRGIEPASLHMVLCAETLQRIEPLDEALTQVARLLMPGGCLLFTVPFDTASSAKSASSGAEGAPLARMGWNLLDRVRQAGFTDCLVLPHRSEELGYLGPDNLVFMATR